MGNEERNQHKQSDFLAASRNRAEPDDIGPLSDIIRVMLKLADEAAKEILIHYCSPSSVARKEDGSPVTPADEAANGMILAGLHEAFPGIPVLAEESGDPPERFGARWVFVVDPLDGTKEYIARNDEFSVNIALLEWNVPVAGVVWMPVTGRVFWGAHGLGAWMGEKGETNGLLDFDEKGEPPQEEAALWQRIHVSDRTDGLVLALSRSHLSTKTEAVMANPRVARTLVAGSSLKGCLIACGKADVYYRFGRTMEWDTAAMQVVVEEAGGVVRQMDGSKMAYNKNIPDNPIGFFILNRVESQLLSE